MSKELINKTEKPEYFQELIKTASGDHFVKEEHWIDSKEPGYGISLSVNKTVIPLEYKKKIQDFKEENSLSELIKHGFIENVTIEIYRIIGDYLSINIKSKSINTSAGISVLFEYITEECGNLELQEINFIFKSGSMVLVNERLKSMSPLKTESTTNNAIEPAIIPMLAIQFMVLMAVFLLLLLR